MKPLTTFYARVRLRSQAGLVSIWSPPILFTTSTGELSGVELQKIIPSDGKGGDNFGNAVAISHDGQYLFVSAYLNDTKKTDAGCVYVYLRNGNAFVQQAKLTASDGAAKDYYGWSLSTNRTGDTLAIGAYQDDDKGSESGSVYIYRRSGTTWALQQKIVPSNGYTQDFFGNAVSLNANGDLLAIGAYGDNLYGADEGSVYVYARYGSTWVLEEQLYANDAFTQDYFGGAVALSADGNVLVVGATGAQSGGRFRGSGYVFRRENGFWSAPQKLTRPNAVDYDALGYDVAVSGDGTHVAISGFDTTGAGYTKGQVIVYAWTGSEYAFETRLLANDAANSDRFGASVSMSYDALSLVVGAHYDDDKGTNSGSVYVFRRAGTLWSQVKKLKASDGQANDYFGFSSKLSGDGRTLIVGAYAEDAKASNAGAVYLYA